MSTGGFADDPSLFPDLPPREEPPATLPAAAYTALGVAIQAYEPEAAVLLAKSPAALLQVLLEAGRRAAVAAAPAIREAPPLPLGEGFLP